MEPKTWSLSYELHTIEAAVDAARILVECVEHHQLGTEDEHRRAPTAAAAVLALVSVRMRDIGRALRGELAAEALCAPHNASAGEAASNDIVLGRKRSRGKHTKRGG